MIMIMMRTNPFRGPLKKKEVGLENGTFWALNWQRAIILEQFWVSYASLVNIGVICDWSDPSIIMQK